jgi:hypothetical protein
MASGDWTFNNTNWELDSGNFYSATTSWRGNGAIGSSCRMLARTTVVPIAYVKEGRYEIWLRAIQQFSGGNYETWRFLFRYQDADNYYCVEVAWNGSVWTWQIIRRYTASETTLRTWTSAVYPPNQTWWQFRISWFNLGTRLIIQVDRWTGTAWTQLFASGYCSNNYWSTTGGQIGFECVKIITTSGNIDDITIRGSTV